MKTHPECKQIDEEYFNNYGGYNYSDNYFHYTHSPAKVLRNLKSLQIVPKTILDIGCASGELVRDFRELGAKAYGIEFNPEILAKSICPQFCTLMDMRDMSSIKNNTFDVCYTNSLMYLQPIEVPQVLLELYRITKRAIYICCPYLEDYTKGNMPTDPYRVFMAKRSWWDKQFQKAGFYKGVQDIYLKQY